MAARGFYVGIDVSKATLDVFIEGSNASFQVTNDDDGLGNLLKRLEDVGNVELVVFESTGRYHDRLHAALVDAEISTDAPMPLPLAR